MKNTCRIVSGRLLEIDVAAGYQATAEVDDMIAMIVATVSTAPPDTRLVIAADWRMCKVFTAEVADRAIQMLSAPHMKKVERSAILHRADAPTSVMQVFRLVRDAQFTHRKVFTDADGMRAWLGEVLDDRERERLKTFLAHRSP